MNQQQKSILIIEDNIDFLESTADLLRLSNFTVHTATSGEIGIQKARTHKPDLVLCDITMAPLDGYQVLNILNRDENTIDIPFIFLTSRSAWTDIRKGMDLGADDYLIKPFDEPELLNAIDARLQKRERIFKSTLNISSLESLIDEAQSAKLLTDSFHSSRVRTYKKRQHIYLRNEMPESIYMVKYGKIRSYRMSEDGRELVTGIFSSGDFFGYEAALLNKPYSNNCEALDNSEIYLLPKNQFNSLLFKDVRIAKRFIELLSNNVVDKQDQLLKLAYNTVKKRVADALIQLAMKFHTTSSSYEIKITRDGLAAMVGTAIETVSRTLSDFKEEGIIEKEGSMIKILSIDKLKQVR